MAGGLDLPLRHGALVSDVEPDGPGDNAGLKRRDIIVALNGSAIGSARELNNAVYEAKAGDKIVFLTFAAERRI